MSGKRRQITWEVDKKGCHNCTSHCIDTDGYPLIWKDGANQHMHRVLYEEAHHVELPKEIQVRHTCDNRACINLDHLTEGTTQDNTRDRVERGRSYKPKGEMVGTSKLTEEEVRMIKKESGSQTEIAKKYGVDQSQISVIKRGKQWKHVL